MEENEKNSIELIENKIKENETEDENNIKIQEKLDNLSANRRRVELEASEHSDIIRMRRGWSKCILKVIVSIVVIDFYVIIGVGHGWLNFKNDVIVPFFIGESFLKIIGLALIIVHFLFNPNSLKKK